MTDITIPDEVVEAAARAFIERRVDAAVWPHFSDERKRGYQEEMRAAIIAALKAWPGMHWVGNIGIHLPRTQETDNE